MPPITALLHTSHDALRLGRALETLHPCAEILIVDHCSNDATPRIAREYGARIFPAVSQTSAAIYLALARCDWILCLDPRESLTEGLQATLVEWTSLPPPSSDTTSFSLFLREQIRGNWLSHRVPQTRLVSRKWDLWAGFLPAYDPASIAMEGELLRLTYP
jgi:glycosyltransferase involved in cell wall biosynthesis